MNAMIEKVAIALAPDVWSPFDVALHGSPPNQEASQRRLLALARRALEAMREPTEAMVEAGEAAAWDEGNHMPAFRAIPSAFRAMIDAALAK